MPYFAGLYTVESASEIRRQANQEAIERDRDFWMKKTEALHAQLQKMFEDAEQDGKLSLSHKGKTIRLQVVADLDPQVPADKT